MPMYEDIKDRIILDTIVGSHLYGTTTPESDIDYVGIFMPTEEYVYGFQRVEEVECSIKSKDNTGRNTNEAVDKKFYEYRKFMKLLIENNPNITEIIFSNKHIINTSYSENIFALRDRIFHKGLIKKFIAYSHSQKHKMFIKAENYKELLDAVKIIEDQVEKLNRTTLIEITYMLNNPINSIMTIVLDDDFKPSYVKISDLHFNPGATIKMVFDKIKKRIDSVGHRKELFTKYGYDSKFGCNVVRLLLEGRRLLKEQQLVFPFPEDERQMIMDIKLGKLKADEIIQIADNLEKEIDSLKEMTKLPEKIDFDRIQKFVIDEMKRSFSESRIF